MLLLRKNSDIILGINANILNLLHDFRRNLSNRRKIDSEFYIELMFLEKFLQDNNMEIVW